jgi:hypothetical protein
MSTINNGSSSFHVTPTRPANPFLSTKGQRERRSTISLSSTTPIIPSSAHRITSITMSAQPNNENIQPNVSGGWSICILPRRFLHTHVALSALCSSSKPAPAVAAKASRVRSVCYEKVWSACEERSWSWWSSWVSSRFEWRLLSDGWVSPRHGMEVPLRLFVFRWLRHAWFQRPGR